MNRIYILLIVLLTGLCAESRAQFAPQVPLPGNDAIKDNSPLITAWASDCTVYRGWLDIADKPLGLASMGNATDVPGPTGSGLVSLGDSGVAVVTFAYSIYNGEGPDFAVFENAFANPDNDTQAYLELAFVEVSSDGVNFFRFPATSAMQDTLQIDNFSYSDARSYHNLAGKYISHYGTPFDLEELKDLAGLDIDHITHIRIVDVTGTIDPQYASSDKDGHSINDPYPSPYPSGGFDLNAVGVLHSNAPPTTGIASTERTLDVRVYPNPATDRIYVHTQGNGAVNYRLTDISGRELSSGTVNARGHIPLQQQARGLYLLRLSQGQQQATVKINKL